MTEPCEPTEENDGEDVRELVKRALATDSLTKNPPDILLGVQRRIRTRSRGKFFVDGWSTSQARHGYVLVACVTLILAAVAYCALVPLYIR